MKPSKPAESVVWGPEPSPGVGTIKAAITMGGMLKWDAHRFAVLCNRLKIAPDEVMALCGIFDRKQGRRMYEKGKWPDPVCMHLSKLEYYAFSSLLPDEQERVIGALMERFRRTFPQTTAATN